MPIFEYFCEACAYKVELIVKRAEQPIQCPDCLNDLTKQISVPAPPQFRGGGLFSATAKIHPKKENE